MKKEIMKHTQGEWNINAQENLIVSDGKWIAELNNDGLKKIPKEEFKANAKLIAAAPELLWSLRQLLSMDSSCSQGYKKAVRELAQKAIKKATA